ncbi:MAG: hypothetical protein KDD40_06525, partial [Bdellovibrionales bacterium]|nr:hypothetical protein [Bdellovibrionales bacterium]
FSIPGALHRGLLTEDLYKEARRLARKGLGINSKVIVVGNGLLGQGEEGRLAWTLLYMGIHNVQFVALNYFKKLPMTAQESPPKANAKMWKPHLVQTLFATKEEIKIAMTPARTHKKTYLIDVRSEKEYFHRSTNGDYDYPDLNAIHIPWNKFLTNEGRPNFSILKDLTNFGVQKNDRIITISQQGVRSAAVTAALTSMGYTNVGNFNGGYQLLFPQKNSNK